jgi:hypothetical protein
MNIKPMTQAEQKIVYSTYALSMAYYSFALLLALRNISRHIVGEKRYKESGSFLALFYMFSVAAIIPRMAQLSFQVLWKG